MIAIGSDHGGVELKEKVIKHLQARGIECEDTGCYSTESCDYPVYAKKVTDLVTSGKCELGILICGTGIGMSMAANKVDGIRAALCLFQRGSHKTAQQCKCIMYGCKSNRGRTCLQNRRHFY